MRRDTDYFGEQELTLVYIARRLKEALRIEELFNGGGLDYAIETEPYMAGFLFRTQRMGAFFYVARESEQSARFLLLHSGFTPHDHH